MVGESRARICSSELVDTACGKNSRWTGKVNVLEGKGGKEMRFYYVAGY